MWGRGKFFILLFIFSITSCSKRTCGSLPEWPINGSEWKISIHAKDLSEDMSSLSTGEDEIILILYRHEEELKEPLIVSEHQFLKGDKENFILSCQCDSMLLFLLEMDSEREMMALEAVVRDNADQLMQSADLKDYELENKIFGDDDLLSYQIIDGTSGKFTLEGRKTMDRFVYEIELNPIEPNR